MSLAQVHVVESLHPIENVRALYAAIKHLPRMPAGLLWIDAEAMRRLQEDDPLVRQALEAYVPTLVITFLVAHVRKIEAVYKGIPPVGYEFFLSQYAAPEVAPGSGLHVDSNEPEWESANIVWSSVYHVGPTHVKEGGGTVLFPEVPASKEVEARSFRRNTFEELEAIPALRQAVPFRENQLIAFDGRVHHYADRCAAHPGQPRIAFVVTAWESRPRFAPLFGHSLLSISEYRAFTESPEADVAAVGAYLAVRDRLGQEHTNDLANALERIAKM